MRIHEWLLHLPRGEGHLLRQGARHLPTPGGLLEKKLLSVKTKPLLQGNSGVSSGVVFIESGEKVDQRSPANKFTHFVRSPDRPESRVRPEGLHHLRLEPGKDGSPIRP